MAAELGKAYVQIVPKAEGIGASITQELSSAGESAGKSAGISIAGGVGSALKSATGLLAAGTTALTGSLIAGSNAVAAYGDNIDKMSQKMGISAQGYQEWEAVMQHSGTSMETMKASMKTLANAVENGNGAFERIGISLGDLETMSQEDIFAATIAGLQNVDNETERTYLAGQLLGRGATELGALLNTSAEDTQAMMDRVRELGGVMSDEAVKAAAAFQDNMQDLKTAIGGVGRNMVSQLLPSMNSIIAGFTSLIAGEEGATQAISEGFSSLFDSIGGIAEGIVNTLTTILPTAISSIAEIFPEIITMAGELIVSIATGLIEALPNLVTTVIPALLETAVNLIAELAKAIITAAPALASAGLELAKTLGDAVVSGNWMQTGSDSLKQMLSGITAGLPQAIENGVAVASNIINGVVSKIPDFIRSAADMLHTFLEFIITNAPTLLQGGMELLMNVVQGIVENLPEIVKATVELITMLLQTIVEHLPEILQMGIELVGELIVGLIQCLPEIGSAALQLAQGIFDAFLSIDWIDLGIQIINGVINGIKNMAGNLATAAFDAAKGAFDAACDFLGINSPAKKGIYIGEMLDAGFADGISDNSDLVDSAVNDLASTATSDLMLATKNADFSISAAQNNKIDVLISILSAYLPEIAENKGVSVDDLYNGLNRQLGWAVQ